MTEHDVIAVRPHTHEICELILDRKDVIFEPGESVVLFGPDHISRPYSIASGVDDAELRFLIRRMANGELSPWLADRGPGDRVVISEPFGAFRPGAADGASMQSVFVATGVGIAPFLSYAQSVRYARRPRCLYGVRYLSEAFGLDLLRTRTDLELAISREEAEGHHGGRVTDLLPELPLEGDGHFFLCGYDAMVDEVTYWLHEHGVPRDRIHGEVFFGVSPG